MTNIEIKLRCLPDFQPHVWLARLDLKTSGQEIQQEDIYFYVTRGRLKLRRTGRTACLIRYERSDESKGRESRYEIVNVDDGEAMKNILAEHLGIRAVVKKRRLVYFWKNVRLHVDEVDGLGRFIEIESVTGEGISKNEADENFNEVYQAIPQGTAVPVAQSYGELVLNNG
ncbi:MAG: class IV adenylate cyclase [Elusimicrobia bacterium]|nr:class IV adenylate cyclase [Elusimicrobiota bacterium]